MIAAAAPAAGSHSGGIIYALEVATLPGKAVLAILLFTSIVSWTVMFTKFKQVRVAERRGADFLKTLRAEEHFVELFKDVSVTEAKKSRPQTIEEVLKSPIVSDPLRILECCAMSVGSAAALLVSEELAYQLSNNPCRLYTAGGSHTLRTGDRRHMEIPLLPHEKASDYEKLYKDLEMQDGRWPGFESFAAARFAAYLTYGMAGIKNPIEDFDLVETHDAFTISDLQTYGDVGLTLYGNEQDYVTSGDCYLVNPHTGKPGRCPSNLSGGLLGSMHAVGATGIFSCSEIFWQLQGKYDKFHGDPKMWARYGKKKPSDWQSLQVKNPKRGLYISHAGVGSHVTTGVLEKAW